MKIEFNDVSLLESKQVLTSLLPLLQKNNIVIFDGPMGSGKTTLIKALCAELGVIDQVNSPTYSIVNEYKTKESKLVYHFDFYRITHLEEAFDMGAEEYFYAGNLCLIEWADRVAEILPDKYLKVSIAYNHAIRNYTIEQI